MESPLAPCKRCSTVGQQLPTLLDVACCVRLHTLLHIAACSWELWVAEGCATMLDLFAQLFPTLLGPHTPFTHVFQGLMGCILLTMHCRSQHCWELLHPFAHHCKHGHKNSHHCWSNTNNVKSCYVRLFVALVAFKRFLRQVQLVFANSPYER